MRCLLISLIFLLAACGKATLPAPPAGLPRLGNFPSPAQLARNAPARQASGSDADVNRTLQSDGALYVPWPGFSSNAEVSGNAALLQAMDENLSYVLYQIGTPLVDDTDTLTELRLDYTWATPPAAPEGLYIGLADHENDHWVWLDGETARGTLLSIEELNIHGVAPGSPNGSFIAVVNFSGSAVTFNSIALRFKTPETVEGDEWLYFTEQPESAPAGISRISPVSGSIEPILVGEGVLPDMVEYGVPQVANYSGTWKLDYAVAGGAPPELWRCDLDGSNQIAVQDDPSAAYNPVGHLDGTERSLFMAVSGGPVYELRASDGVNSGRLSRAGDLIFGATWDLSLDPGIEYGAIAALTVDSVNYYQALMRFYGSGPFPINATPEELYARLPTESVADPEMFEYASLSGDPRYDVYFVARNRDDVTFNIYRVRYPGGEPEPVVVDPNYELHYPSVSPDGQWLAYVRLPAGSTSYTIGELMLTSLLDPDSGSQVVSDRVLYELSWYDPTP